MLRSAVRYCFESIRKVIKFQQQASASLFASIPHQTHVISRLEHIFTNTIEDAHETMTKDLRSTLT